MDKSNVRALRCPKCKQPLLNARPAVLRQRRESHGMSQAQVARKLKVTPAYICMIENGHARLTPKVLRFYTERIGA